MLIFLIILSISLSYFSTYFFLTAITNQTAQEFSKQNFIELQSDNIPQITVKLNTLADLGTWECVIGKHKGNIFFSKSSGSCANGIFQKQIKIIQPQNPSFEFDMTIALPLPLKVASILFSALQISVLALLFRSLSRIVKKENEFKERLSNLSAKLAHNIRNPVNTLTLLATKLASDTTTSNIVHDCIQQIQNLSRDVLDEFKTLPRSQNLKTHNSSNVHVASQIDNLLQSFRLLHPEISFYFTVDAQNYDLFINFDLVEFRALLANILDNAAQAKNTNSPVIDVQVKPKKEKIQITVSDNGKGIPASILPRIFKENISFGKTNGTGIGLTHAKQWVELFYGTVNIESIENVSTSIVIELPQQPRPSWFIESIPLSEVSNFLILDNDQTLLKQMCELIPLARTFLKPKELLKWMLAKPDHQKPVLLCDFDLGENEQTGAELVESLKAEADSYLISYRSDHDFLKHLNKVGQRFIPKSILPFVLKHSLELHAN